VVKAKRSAGKSRRPVTEADDSSDECRAIIANREKSLEWLAADSPAKLAARAAETMVAVSADAKVLWPAFTMGGLPAGPLQELLQATNDSAFIKVAEIMRRVDMTTLGDFDDMDLEAMQIDLEKAGCRLSSAMYKRVKNVVAGAKAEASKKTVLEATAAKAILEVPKSLMPGRAGKVIAADGAAAAKAAALLAAGCVLQSDELIDVTEAHVFEPRGAALTKPKPVVKNYLARKARLSSLLSGLSPEEAENVNFVRNLCHQILLAAGKLVIDDKDSEAADRRAGRVSPGRPRHGCTGFIPV